MPKISELPLATEVLDTDEYVFVQGGITKKATKSLMLGTLNTTIGGLQTTVGTLQTDVGSLQTTVGALQTGRLKNTTDTMNGTLYLGGTSVAGNEGGQMIFDIAPNSTLAAQIVFDQYIDKLRFYVAGGDTRGFVLDFANAAASYSSIIYHSNNFLAGTDYVAPSTLSTYATQTYVNTAVANKVKSDVAQAGTGSAAVQNMVKITQADYNLLTPDANTLYLIIG